MNVQQKILLPRFIVFEGVDGTGKTALFNSLVKYYKAFANNSAIYADAFPGSIYGTLGEWVYRLHHNKTMDSPSPDNISPFALQLLHVAAHVDTILTRVIPMLETNGYVILDRYWWSAYAYSRSYADPELAWSLVSVERKILDQLPRPVVIYLTRSTSLKPDEINCIMHTQLDTYYREIFQIEREAGVEVYELNNDSSMKQVWESLLKVLELPYHEM